VTDIVVVPAATAKGVRAIAATASGEMKFRNAFLMTRLLFPDTGEGVFVLDFLSWKYTLLSELRRNFW
jgi:hypothetical protein